MTDEEFVLALQTNLNRVRDQLVVTAFTIAHNSPPHSVRLATKEGGSVGHERLLAAMELVEKTQLELSKISEELQRKRNESMR